jgi:hypothetical protein
VEGKVRRLAVLVVLFIIGVPAVAWAQSTVDVGELQKLAETLNGRSITVTGELIGDYGFRNDGSMWTQLNEDSYVYDPVQDDGALTGANVGVAVRIPHGIAESLDPPGGYRVRGPVVKVTGTWWYHDANRGGESYLDVFELEVVEPGRELVEHPNYVVLLTGAALVIGAGLLRSSGKRRPSRRDRSSSI